MPQSKNMTGSEKLITLTIEPRANFCNLNFKEICQYKDLLEMYLKRDIVTL